MITDPIADLLIRIKNAQRTNKPTVICRASKMGENILNVLEEEGYIRGYKRKNLRKGVDEIEVDLKYFENQPVIHEVKRISKPGRRVYAGVEALPKVYNCLGISILTTSKGVMSDGKARELNVSGEVICTVF